MTTFVSMDNDNIIRTLGLMTISAIGQGSAVGKDLIIADTDDSKDVLDAEEVRPLVKSEHPYKLEAALCLVCKGGSMKVRINLIEYSIASNDLMVTMPGEIVQCLEISPDCRLTLIGFSDKYYYPITSGEQVNTMSSFFIKRPVNHLDNEKVSDLLSIIGIMRRRLSNPATREKELIIKGYINALIIEAYELISDILTNAPKVNRTRGEIIYSDFMSLLQRHYTSERSVTFYASKLCISPKYLSQTIIEQSGKPATEWIKEYVLLEAKALLGTHRYSVQEISDRLNFANQSFFGTWFKKAVGLSPRQYLQKDPW